MGSLPFGTGLPILSEWSSFVLVRELSRGCADLSAFSPCDKFDQFLDVLYLNEGFADDAAEPDI